MEGAIGRLEAETSVSQLLHATCRELVAVLGASGAVISRVIGDLIVELSNQGPSGDAAPLELYLLADYPLTAEVLERGEPQIVVRSDAGADPAEAALLARLGHDALLMLPLTSRGQTWGLVEVYADARGFSGSDAATAEAIVARVGERLGELESAG